MRGHTLFRYTALAACTLCYVTILLGGNVMASNSGLACPQWPSCHGSFAPPFVGAIAIEWTHRLAAFVLSSSIAALLALGIAYERARPVLLKLSVAAFLLVVAQALLGGLVVESDLATGVVLTHLGLATVLFSLLLLLALLANLREVPRRWIDWAQRAAREAPRAAAEPGTDLPGPTPERGPVPTGAEPLG